MTPDDGTLLDLVARGSRESARDALAELYGRHAPALLAFLARTLGQRADAEDLLHDTFVAAARRAAGFDGADARPWLTAIAANRLRDHLRGRRRRAWRERAASRPEAAREDGDQARETDGADLERALARLSPRERAVLELRHGGERSHAEVARLLGVSLRTAKDWNARARERLREQLRNRP